MPPSYSTVWNCYMIVAIEVRCYAAIDCKLVVFLSSAMPLIGNGHWFVHSNDDKLSLNLLWASTAMYFWFLKLHVGVAGKVLNTTADKITFITGPAPLGYDSGSTLFPGLPISPW